MFNPFAISSYDALVRWLKAHPPQLAFDIGANRGGYTETLLEHGAKLVVAFEPLPMFADKVRAKFAGDARVEVQQIALGENEGRREGLSVLNCWTIADQKTTTLEKVPDFAGQKFDIDFSYIDSGKFGIPDFVKLDADGYEPAILRGASKMLQTKRPAILLELSFLPLELGDSCDRMVYDLYVKHKYVFVSVSGNVCCHNYRNMLEYFPWNTSYDVLAVPDEHSSFFS